MKDRVARVLATWFGCGYVPRAPGTAGTLGALPIYLFVRGHGRLAVLAVLLVLLVVGVWAAGRMARRLGVHDPQVVVIDEVCGVHVAWLAAGAGWKAIAIGFGLFRVFDWLKPWPARWIERRLPDGWGIVLDDVVAGAYAAAALAALSSAGVLPSAG